MDATIASKMFNYIGPALHIIKLYEYISTEVEVVLFFMGSIHNSTLSSVSLS